MSVDKDEYVLFVDETGTASLKDNRSPYYILSGLVIKESERDKLKHVACNIKYKFWNNPDIVLHSVEIGRKESIFSIFKDQKTLGDFLDDLENYLFKREFNLLYVLIDKDEARKRIWDHRKIYKETSNEIIKNFLYFLLSRDAKGKIVVESATTQKDMYFMEALSRYLSNGIPERGITHIQVKSVLTSISFVTKNNFDTEEQLADIFAYAAKCHYQQQQKLKNFSSRYEKLIMRVLAARLITKSTSQIVKPKYQKLLESQVRLP